MSLNPKQQRFCEEYVVDFNATRAAIDAGYSPKTARSQGQRLLTNVDVAARVEELREKLAERTEVTAERVRREFGRVAFTDMADFVEWGQNSVKLKESSELSADDTAAVNEVSISYSENGKTVKFKLADKMAALKTLAVHTGLVERDQKGGVNVNLNIDNRRNEEKPDLSVLDLEEKRQYVATLRKISAGSDGDADDGGRAARAFESRN